MTATKLQQMRENMRLIVQGMNKTVSSWEKQVKRPSLTSRLDRQNWKRAQVSLEMLRQEVDALLALLEKKWSELTDSVKNNIEEMIETLQERILYLQEDLASFRTDFRAL